MRVKELMEVLKDLEPDAQVIIASQPNWPFEVELTCVVTRAECEERDAESQQRPTLDRGMAPTDVLLVEGQQLRYGSKTPFLLARRPR